VPEIRELDDVLELVRAQSNLNDREWLDLCENVRARFGHADQLVLIASGDLADLEREVDELTEELGDMPRIHAFVGVKGLAELLDVTPNLVRQWKSRDKLPTPTEVIDDHTPCWDRATVRRWTDELREMAG
jgi:hypothetical protein